MDIKFTKPYNPEEEEKPIYSLWEANNAFAPSTEDTGKEPFSIVLPPPNVTGILHLGHTMMIAVEDALVRHARMQGRPTVWIPGTDHAGIATQALVEKELYKKEKKRRSDMTREEFLEKVEAFAKDKKGVILSQIRAMGASVDWSRERYTLHPQHVNAVQTAFKEMYDKGLIYRGDRLINWDPKLKTTISDEEVEYVEKETTLYYLQYGPFVIATTRPETKFGDKYVVIHPDDSRYSEYSHGQEIELEWINGAITATIIKDDCIDPEFGTGVMTITPWHDKTDYEIAKRHDLSYEQIIDYNGLLLPIAGSFKGEHISKARAKIIEVLKEKNLLTKEEPLVHNVSISGRSGEYIEPQIKKQWFVAVDKPFTFGESQIDGIPSGSEQTIKSILLHVINENKITIVPDRFNKVYLNWVGQLHDWCISRQLWFGHQIPVWYKGDEIHCGTEAPKGDGWEQDPDTLDTWFSSGLWTCATLGWPEKTEDFLKFHPTSVLETGYDILFFWIVRMILMTTVLTGQIPFKEVYLHGLVRDEKGRKMSKSLGTQIDPLDMVKKYGSDATRLALVVGVTPGNDINLSEEKIRSQKHFANKLWNISRFILQDEYKETSISVEDEKLINELDYVIKEVSENIEAYRLNLAIEKIQEYTWHRLADEIIEDSKNLEGEKADSRKMVLRKILVDVLKLLHPFMPYITEVIWQEIPERPTPLIINTKWPTNSK